MSQPATLPAPSLGGAEAALIVGDLSKLSPEQRQAYYLRVCESLGLNPLTRPFEYLTLNGRLILYARKDCTDQLRSLHDVSVSITARERQEDVFIVTARARLPSGRVDESIGAVTIAALKGDALCNAVMKAETKAKRRVTLSICGMGMLDETETETIRVEPTEQPEAPALPPPAVPPLRPGAGRESRLRAAARKHRREWRLPQLLALLAGQHQTIDQLDDAQEKIILDHLAAPARYKDEPPADGPLLLVLIEEVEANLLHADLCAAGDLLAAMLHAMDPAPTARLPAWKDWTAEHVSWGWQQVKDFARARRAAKAAPPVTAA